MRKLSIILPVYNEEKTLETIVDKIQKVNFGLEKLGKAEKIEKELIIVNDSSIDNSQVIIDRLKSKFKNIKTFKHEVNKGKGAAIKTGMKYVTGDILVIQDGDLEYNPEDFKKLIIPILEGKTKVVYGSRMLGHRRGFSIKSHYYGNKFLTFLTQIIYGQKITDMETCYKMVSKEVIKDIKFNSNRFDFEPEITAKIIKKGYKIMEIPIDYNCRSFEEGKKITWRDGIVAIYTLFKYRFSK